MAETHDATEGIKIKSTRPDTVAGLNTGNLVKSVPFVGGAKSTIEGMLKGPGADPDVQDVALYAGGVISDATGFIQSSADTAMSIASDPIGWLIGQGLNFLLNVVQPLQDLLHMVTGDGPALATASENFISIGKGLESMSADFVKVADEALTDWSGDAADSAKKALAEFADGISGVSAKSGNVAEVLQMSSMLMKVVEEVIKAIITELITWLIMIWIPALAAAVPTAGASTAAAGSATGVKAGSTATKTTQKVSKLRQILDKIRAWFEKLKATLSKTFSKGGVKQAFLGSGGAHGKRRELLQDALLKDNGGVAKTIAKEAGKSGLNAGIKEMTGIDPGKAGQPGRLGQGIVAKQIDNAKKEKATEVGHEQSDEETREDLDF
ncbi:WXG100 family type VII secretion target [Amycolatopsis nigrescens]|uniref:WXG100 family type VII secretion target n=1 Tax=Amycolatopsis nigrescens TaxID=381445 RepID=UPI00035C8F23|nr:WXG100 family type VII secretion target [Amycolatopsis nigrescens]